ncbi:hypothetical protein GPECTOR_17g844 [Gonium pectorale]|uniref:Uncharacterized protein n=1 Tax=Gonium pectorale TaxID=33097 RepID=A0A150GK92_GONPE|nr:hypothetical protein GPECTOR_17g844 [Gonium pectorale]|eukprot:KXZ50207.1 hypothetical protein GPECTOR_17g844 [Gonium pectorale]
MPRFGSLTFGTGTAAAAFMAGADAGAGGSGSPASGSRTGSARGSASGAQSGSAEVTEASEVASNKWTVAPFPTRFLWSTVPSLDAEAGTAGGPAEAGVALTATAPVPPPVPSPRADASLTAGQRGRMRRASATEAIPAPMPSHRTRGGAVAASTDGFPPAPPAGASMSSGQLMVPSLPPAQGSTGSGGDAPAASGSPPMGTGPTPRTAASRGGRFKSQLAHVPQLGGDTAESSGDQNKNGRMLSVSGGAKEGPTAAPTAPVAIPGVKERLPAPPALRGGGGRDPAGQRNRARISGPGVELAPDTDAPLAVARSGASLTTMRSGASFSGLQQQRLRGSIHDGASSGSGGALRPTPLSLPQQHSGGAAAAAAAVSASGNGSPSASPAAAAAQPPHEMVGRAGSSSHLANASAVAAAAAAVAAAAASGAPPDAAALSLLSRVGRVQPKAPPPQEWKVDPRAHVAEIDAGPAPNGAHGYPLGRPQHAGSWTTVRLSTADGGGGGGGGGQVAGRPWSPNAEPPKQLSGARTAPVSVPMFDDAEGSQRAPGAEAAGDSPNARNIGGLLPRQLPALVGGGRSNTPPPAAHGSSGPAVLAGPRPPVRASNTRGATASGEERFERASAPLTLAMALAPNGLGLRGTVSPARAPRPTALLNGAAAPSSPMQQQPPLQLGAGGGGGGGGGAVAQPKPPAGGVPQPPSHPPSSGRHRGSQGSAGPGSAAGSFSAGQQESAELRRARLLALSALERPVSPTGNQTASGGVPGGGGGSGGDGTAAPAAVAPLAKLPGLTNQGDSRKVVLPAAQAQQKQQKQADGQDGKEAGSEEHESIMMRMKKALSFLRRGD